MKFRTYLKTLKIYGWIQLVPTIILALLLPFYFPILFFSLKIFELTNLQILSQLAGTFSYVLETLLFTLVFIVLVTNFKKIYSILKDYLRG